LALHFSLFTGNAVSVMALRTVFPGLAGNDGVRPARKRNPPWADHGAPFSRSPPESTRRNAAGRWPSPDLRLLLLVSEARQGIDIRNEIFIVVLSE